MTPAEQVRTFFRALDQWCDAAHMSIFQLSLRCERNEWYFYHNRRRGVLPQPLSVRAAAAVLGQPVIALFLAAGWLLPSDLQPDPGWQTTVEEAATPNACG